MPKKNKGTGISPDFVIRGEDYLPSLGFKLIGRDVELADISNVLLRMNTDNLILTGPPGVGITSLCLGLQSNKEKLDTPFDLVSKRFFWLDSDALFASGDMKQINEGFQRTLKTVTRAPNSVLIIEDMRDFIDGAQANGVRNIVNALMRTTRRNRALQLIVQCRDTDLPEVLKCHSDMLQFFVIKEIRAFLFDEIAGGIPQQGECEISRYGVYFRPPPLFRFLRGATKRHVVAVGTCKIYGIHSEQAVK